MNDLAEIIAGVLILAGGLFSVVAAIGLVRLPDVLTRMHASTKTGTLASLLILIGCALHFGSLAVLARCLLAILFLLLTAPIGAHMLGRAAARRDYGGD